MGTIGVASPERRFRLAGRLMAARAKPVLRSLYQSVADSLTWRVTGSTDTFIGGALITRQPAHALQVAAGEFLTKIPLNLCFRLAGSAIKVGVIDPSTNEKTRARRVVDAVVYRLLGSADVYMLARLSGMGSTAKWVALYDLTTKIPLYYGHDTFKPHLRRWTRDVALPRLEQWRAERRPGSDPLKRQRPLGLD
ncbi:MAG: DUF2061 domain-containing protein [Pseudomonadota bacterium]|nr:DUF2061 domain-containing protein [Pseudomonadota bacterium]